MPESFYLWRLRETEAFAAVRQGYAPDSLKWRMGTVSVINDDVSRALQLCDIISHSSRSNFTWCDAGTKSLFKESPEDYRWTMSFTEQLDRVGQLIEDRSLGVALIALIELFVLEDDRKAILGEAGEYLSRVLDELAEMAAPVRDSQLATPLNWLEQIITLRRDLALGRKATRFLKEEVEAHLRERLGARVAELDWFTYALCRWALTVCNHGGALVEARDEVAKIERLVPSLAGRWEHFTLLTEGLIARAVHQMDCFQFTKASEEMRRIAERYEGLAKAFSEAYPELYPPDIHSDLRAKALGTWLQSMMLGGLTNEESLSCARELSDAAMAEFLDEDDRERQWQYRCHLETLAGDFHTALEFLARSLKADPSHASVAKAIAELADEPVEQGFALMHWLRLGSAILLAADSKEGAAAEFSDALAEFSFSDNPWCSGRNAYYPAHSILRRLAVINCLQRRDAEALRALNTLHRLYLNDGHMGVDVILLAAQAEVSALMWDYDPYTAAGLLSADSEEPPGLLKLAALLRTKTDGRFPELANLAASFSSTVEELIRPENPVDVMTLRKKLLELGQSVRY